MVVGLGVGWVWDGGVVGVVGVDGGWVGVGGGV